MDGKEGTDQNLREGKGKGVKERVTGVCDVNEPLL